MRSGRLKQGRVSQDEAEAIATQALAYIAGDAARLGRFLAESGLGPENVRKAAHDPSFLPAVLDYVLSHEQDLIDFAAMCGIDPSLVGRARQALAGVSPRI